MLKTTDGRTVNLEPALIIHISDLRRVAARDLETLNIRDKDGIRENVALVREAAGYLWGNGILWLRSSSGGALFQLQIHYSEGPKNKPNNWTHYGIYVYDNLRGLLFSDGFNPSDDGKIPYDLLNKLEETLSDFVRGNWKCRRCGAEINPAAVYGKYYDSMLCKDCASDPKVVAAENDRSR